MQRFLDIFFSGLAVLLLSPLLLPIALLLRLTGEGEIFFLQEPIVIDIFSSYLCYGVGCLVSIFWYCLEAL